MRTITLEEHFASPGFLDGPGRGLKAQALKFGGSAAKLFEQLGRPWRQEDRGNGPLASICKYCRSLPRAQSSSKLLSFGVRPRNE
jgi:hypothetical protein